MGGGAENDPALKFARTISTHLGAFTWKINVRVDLRYGVAAYAFGTSSFDKCPTMYHDKHSNLE